MTMDSRLVNSTPFKLILTGIREDIPIEKVRHALADLLKTTPSNIDLLVTRLPYVLKKHIRADQADRYKAAIENAGGICRIEKDEQYRPEVTAAIEKTRGSPAAPFNAEPQALSPQERPVSTAERATAGIQPHAETAPKPLPGLFQTVVAEVRRFFLLDIPKRSVALNFKFPSPSVRAKVGSASSVDLYAADSEPLEFFKLLHSRIKFLNFAKLRTGARLRATRHLLKIFHPPAIDHMVLLARTGGVPESESSRQALILIGDTASILITSYALVFANYYEGSQYHYARQRKKVLELASCIFELLLLKQRARALRYQRLEPNDWSMANTVFYVMRAYEDVERPVPKRTPVSDVDAPQAQRSLTNQFVLLHICAWFDLLRLPTSLQWVIGSYLLKVETAVPIREDTGTLKSDELIVYCHGKQAAEPRRMDTPAGPALILNLRGLMQAMHQDCAVPKNLNRRDASPVMPRFAHFETADHFVIRNQFLNRLNLKEEKEGKEAVSSNAQQVDDLRLFVGFSAVFATLRHRSSAFASEDRLEDSLSKRSAVFAVDGREIRQSLWSLSFQSNTMIRLTTTEGQETTAMGVGMLLAYGAGDEIHRPRLAVVSRLLRHAGRVLELDMRSVAHFCEPVILSFNAVKVAGLMLYEAHNGGRWSLAFAPRDVLIGVDQVELHRHQKVISVELKAILDASRDFYLAATTLTSSQLGFYSEPQYPPAVVKKPSFRMF